MLWTWIVANGDKLFSWMTGIFALLTTPTIAMSLGLNERLISWLTFGSAVIALTHATFISPSQQQAATATLKAKSGVQET